MKEISNAKIIANNYPDELECMNLLVRRMARLTHSCMEYEDCARKNQDPKKFCLDEIRSGMVKVLREIEILSSSLNINDVVHEQVDLSLYRSASKIILREEA